jgi:signal transduction histidine kinase
MTTWVDALRGVRVRWLVEDAVIALVVAIAAGAAASGAHSSALPLLVLLAVAAGLSLSFRRVYPVTVFAITVAITSFFAVVYDGYWPFAALIVFYSVATHSPRRPALVAGVVGLVVLGVAIATTLEWQPVTWSTLALLAGRLAPLVAAWILGDNLRTRRAYLQAVEERAAQLEREQDANARRAVAEEQSRIAREVHDVVAHNLSVIIVQATAAETVFASDPDEAKRAVHTIGETARQALGELRRVLSVVEGDEGLAPQPELDHLDELVEQVRRAGLDVRLQVTGERRRLSPALELSAYRIVQEALTNTLRHAGAQHAEVTVRFDEDELVLEVVDDGEGNGDANGTPGRGLIGMRERAAVFGGRLDAGPSADGGFRVAASLPVTVGAT